MLIKKKDLDSIGVYATYSDIFGGKYDKAKLIELINDLPLGGIINILSQFNSLDIENQKIRQGYFSFILSRIPDSSFIIKKYEGRMLYTSQGLLSIWKWLFSYGDWNKINEEIDLEHGINLILYLHLIISDYLYESKDEEHVLYEFFSNLNFNSTQDAASSLARACIMYDEIAKDTGLFNNKEYIDLNAFFYEKYGYSIKRYLAIVFAIYTSFVLEKGQISPSWAKKIDNYSFFSPIEEIEVILLELSVDLETIKRWSENTLNKSWNFQLFKEKPLIRLENGNYLSISLNFLYEQVFNQLFFKIRECFPKDDEQIISFIGRCFEKYIEIITEKAINQSLIDYQLISEFSFKSNKSPDCMIKLGNKILAIEAKSKRIKLDSLVSSNPETIEFDLNNMIKNPLMQLYKCMKKLTELNHPILDGVDEIYLMVVTQGSINVLSPQVKKIYDDIISLPEVPIRAVYHLDIEEYEWLIAIMSNKGARPIFKILDNKYRLAPYSSFKNFALKGSYSKKRLSFINEKFMQLTNDFGEILTGEKWRDDM